jgi:hypothetical protein
VIGCEPVKARFGISAMRGSGGPALKEQDRTAQGLSPGLIRWPGFDDSLSAVAAALCRYPMEIGLASEARSTRNGWRRRKNEYE